MNFLPTSTSAPILKSVIDLDLDLDLGLGLGPRPAEAEEAPFVPIVPGLGTLSIEEQRALERLLRFETRLRRRARILLEGLSFSPTEEDLRHVVDTFLMDREVGNFANFMLDFIRADSPLFMEFLNEWETYLVYLGNLVENVL
uniref:hypothetical protein n=1 Tax=Bidens parviflora TaxID=1527830 RepID=UPI001FF41489|nr:hypothetical protein MFQ53_mgp04 [Bidens parviflora]UIR98974.1 hypothetical protein [Bidens parviflora]